MSAAEQHTPLLDLLDDVVRRDGGAPGFVGRLAIGVRDGDEVTWWQVTCDRRASAAFVDRPDASCDAVLLLGGREAQSIIETGHIPERPELLRVEIGT